ncbi:uncharacterized protein LOC129722517 [Wyeomyia smithii]|uniref:uncharacterized protein LOC129722517 n=1 Tax=Wyeomyia smithii TaxID=174621 RepID=UPI002467B77F|nr:uncharacterized protein LOC129722517 [Wyeomyia smithii]
MDISCFPNEVLCRIFDFLPWSDRKNMLLVCSRWNEICNSDRYLRQTKLVLYNYSKVQFFSGVEASLLNTQRNIEFHSSAMLDTEELLSVIAEAFPTGESAVESVDLFLRSNHEQLFSLVIQNLPVLKQLKHLNILANEGFKTFHKGLEIRSDTLETLKLSFYRNTTCCVLTPKLRCLNLVIRHLSDITVLNSVSSQLFELTVNFQSKDLVTKLFLCNFTNLTKLHLSIENDKYLPYTVAPSVLSWHEIQIFLNSIKGLKSLEIVDKCNMLRHNYLNVFLCAEALTHLTINYTTLDAVIVEFISNFKNLRILNLQGCSTAGDPVSIDLPKLQKLLMPYKHYSILPCTNLYHLTTLYYSSSQKNHSQYIHQITNTFINLKTLIFSNFDYDLSYDSFQFLDRLKRLKSLTIRDMSVSNQLFANCPTLVALRKLTIKTVVTEISLIECLSDKLPHLHQLNIDNCFFYFSSGDQSRKQFSFDILRKQMPHCRISTIASKVFTNTMEPKVIPND